MQLNESYWFAVYTKPRWEKKVAKLLSEKEIENYCPVNKIIKQWSDRKKTILEPVFKSYVFVKVQDEKKWELKKINGILNFVYWLGKPARIRDEEINTIKKFLNEFSNIEVDYTDIKVNSKVRIKQGVLMNYHGIILEVVGNRAKVKIESMGIQLSAQFDKNNIELLAHQR
ncbi:UpxY family transcription antiterminator [Ferruginibacter albus]|uniref:UpxY family transcription antiterminator n=1 Tax=Ferruginibacter albus TaxID=2875540 RepID=UPI001CC6DF2C|nr:UpxY family transcription antiterminator [Ferruginibacter albus]UAY50705.1 UpxY family transcription antiterminator [Ferruginibacter albus]